MYRASSWSSVTNSTSISWSTVVSAIWKKNKGVGKRLIQLRQSWVLYWAWDPHLNAIFHITWVRRCFNWLKVFMVDKLFILTTFTDSKLVMHVANSAAFSMHSAVFSEECCMEKIGTVIHLIFTHANALINFNAHHNSKITLVNR